MNRLRDGTLVVDDWSIHPAREASGTIALTAGQTVPFVVEYYEAGHMMYIHEPSMVKFREDLAKVVRGGP